MGRRVARVVALIVSAIAVIAIFAVAPTTSLGWGSVKVLFASR